MNERIAPGALAPPPARRAKVVFSGEDGEFRRLVTRGALLELVTFGFYRFWLATNIRRHLWTNTSVHGDALEYTGTGRELLIGFLFALAILVPIYLANFAISIEAERWKAFASLPFGVAFYALYQFAIYRARRYRLTRTLWRGVRFWMTGSGLAYMARALGWTFLTVVTLGLAYPWREAALERYKMSHTFYGDLPGKFDGRGWDLFKRGWWLWLLALAPGSGLGAILVISFAMAPATMHALPSTQLQFSPDGQVFGTSGDRRIRAPGELTPPQRPLGKLNQEGPSTKIPLALAAVLGAGLPGSNSLAQVDEADRGRLGEAVAANPEAPSELTGEPRQWAMTQNGLGLSFRTIGQQESARGKIAQGAGITPRDLYRAMPNSHKARGYYDSGNFWKAKGDLDRAIADYNKAIELDPKDALAYNHRGFAYERKGDLDRAIADYDKAIELDPKYALAYNNRGFAYRKKGDLDRAIADYGKAIELDPKDALAYNHRGFAYERKGDLDRAIADYDKAIELDPKYALAYNNRGFAYRKKGDLDRAIADYGKAIELDPKDALAYSRRGFAYERKGDLDRAIADYDKAIELDPKYALAYNHRGFDYERKGDLDRAIADYDKGIELDPKNAHAYNNRGLIYRTKGDFDRAIADYDKAIELDPKYAHAYNNRGLIHRTKGDFDRAIADYDKAIELDPKDALAYSSRGFAYERKGDLDRAIADYDKAIELNPKDTFAYNHRGLAQRKKGGLHIPQPLRPFVLPLFFAALIAFPFIYPAFKATEWRWWAQSLRFGGVRLDSNVGRAALIANIWEMALCLCAVGIVGFIAIGILFWAITHAIWLVWGIDLHSSQPSPPLVGLSSVLSYLASILAYGIAFRIYMVQRIWKIVVSSVSIENLSSADHVTAKGEAASAVGEGLADSLDVAGF